MLRIDALFTAWPFLGSRRMTAMLRADGLTVNRERVQRQMRVMGIAALGPKPRTTKPAPGHKIFPYLLRDLVIDRPNQVWAADITYIPIGRGFLYLVAIIWASRAVLAWRLSNTMDVAFCSDGRGRWMDTVFIERVWRSLKSEDVYLKGYADGREARAGIALWIGFYNGRRPHQALAGGWTTLPRRPHAHRDNNSNRRLEWRDRRGRSRPSSNQERCSSGPADRGHFSGKDETVGYGDGRKVKGGRIRALVDTLGLPMRVVVHSAGIRDRDGAGLVLDKDCTRIPMDRAHLGRRHLQRPTGRSGGRQGSHPQDRDCQVKR